MALRSIESRRGAYTFESFLNGFSERLIFCREADFARSASRSMEASCWPTRLI